jgi:hypothetical protein
LTARSKIATITLPRKVHGRGLETNAKGEVGMRIWDLVFVVVFLGVVIGGVRVLACALRRRWPEARRGVVRGGAFLAVYIAVVVGVSLATPRRWLSMGEEQRFDDWALTVAGIERTDRGYRVELRVANHGRGRAQRAADAEVVLVAADGRRFAPANETVERSLRSMLQPGESFETTREFTVPPEAEIIGLDVLHGAWPEIFIIGDRGSLLHKRPLVRIP